MQIIDIRNAMMIRCRKILDIALTLAVIGCLAPLSPVFADDDKGNTSGIGADLVYKLDVIGNRSGGIAIGTRVLDNLDVKFSADGEKLFGSKGTSAMLSFLHNNGGRPGADLTGDAEGVDNIEVPAPAGRLYEAWIQQNSREDRLSVLVGMHDLNSEFYVTDTSGLFIRPTFGIGTEMSQTGQHGPSIFPFLSACVRVKAQPGRNSYIQAAAFDGVPGTPGDPRGTHLYFKRGDGYLLIGEAAYLPGGETASGKIGIGAWEYTKTFDDLTDVDSAGNPVQRRSNGAYVLLEHPLYQASGGEGRGLKAFARYGSTSADVVEFDYAWSAGVVYIGLIPGRGQGQLGLAVEGAHTSARYRQLTGSDRSERAYELTYSDNLTSWLSIQPDLQYVINPSADPAIHNAVVAGARLTASF